MVTKKIKISEDHSIYIERLFFEYNALLAILEYLTSKENVNQDALKDYFKESILKKVELEQAKKQVSDLYMPDDQINRKYTFNFDKQEIEYKGEEV